MPQAAYYPVHLSLTGRLVVVVGGGSIAERKVAGLLPSGARVRVVAPGLTPELARLAECGEIEHCAREYRPGDLEGAVLALAEPGGEARDGAFAAEADARGVFANVEDVVEHCSFIAPSVVRRGDLVIAISTSGRAPALAVRLRQRLEQELGPEYGALLELAGRLRGPLMRTVPEFQERRRRWYELVDSEVLAMLRDGRAVEASELAERIMGVAPEEPERMSGSDSTSATDGAVTADRFADTAAAGSDGTSGADTNSGAADSSDVAKMGRVTLIGAGPGDPDLITVLGLGRLRAADVVLHDRLAAPELLAEARPDAEIVDVGKRPGDDVQARQRWIEKLIVDRALAGSRVVRLKGGDPAVFGRGGEEVAACAAAGVLCEVVPGVSSFTAAAAAAGFPLTHRGVSRGFVVVSARNAEGGEPDWAGLAGADTVVVLMSARRLQRIGQGLIAAGRKSSTPAAIVERATTAHERVVRSTLDALAAGGLSGRIEPPCVVIVGDVTAAADHAEQPSGREDNRPGPNGQRPRRRPGRADGSESR